MNNSILFVDDEVHIINGLKRLFHDSDYHIYIAESGEEALKILSNNKIDLIITDIRMPEMDGYELLAIIKKQYPKVFRVILSGYTEDEIALKAIQKNLAKLYVYKPWENQYLLDMVDRIFKFRSNVSSPELINIINNLEGLPTLPRLYENLCQAINRDDDIDFIASIIEKDQAIAAKILHISNSAYYGMKTGSVKQAILNLGLNSVKDIVFATTIFNKNLHSSMMNYFNQLWEHAYICNQFTLLLYEKIFGKKIPTDYLSAGLLHDIGKILLLNIFGVDYFNILKDNCIDNEKNKLGITHQQIGGYLLDWWGFQLPIVEAIFYHHDPLNNMIINKELVAIIHLADYYSWRKLDQVPSSHLDEEVFVYLGQDQQSVEQYINENYLSK